MVEQNDMISGQTVNQKLDISQEPNLQRLEKIFIKRKSDEVPQFNETESYLDGDYSYLIEEMSEMKNEVNEETNIGNIILTNN